MVDPLSYFSFQPVLYNWCNKGCGMFYPVCGMVHIKEPLLLIGKNNLGSGFLSRYLNGPLPYDRCHRIIIKNVLSVFFNKTFHSFLVQCIPAPVFVFVPVVVERASN